MPSKAFPGHHVFNSLRSRSTRDLFHFVPKTTSGLSEFVSRQDGAIRFPPVNPIWSCHTDAKNSPKGFSHTALED
jgi:hypothetical protein